MTTASALIRPCDHWPIAVLQRLIFCCVVAFMAWLPASSFASIPQTTSYVFSSYPSSSTVAGACAATSGLFYPSSSSYISQPYIVNSNQCQFNLVNSSGGFVGSTRIFGYGLILACPVNSTGTATCTCVSGFVENAAHTACEAPPANSCTSLAGSSSTFNVTSGYTRSPQGVLNPPILPDGSPAPAGYTGIPAASMCVNGCTRTLGPPVWSWISQEPTATGLYRMSDDWSFTATATQCTASASETAALNPTASVPACAGFLGSINGKSTCVATSSGNKAEQPVFKPALMGNPTAGSAGGAANIPTAGGTGANGGGPSSSSDGSLKNSDGSVVNKTSVTPTGSIASPAAGQEQAACGAPGQPKCGIDETGTGTGTRDYGQTPISDVYRDLDAAMASLQTDSGKDTSWGFVPRWFTSGGCSPTVLYTLPPKLSSMPVTLDLCPHLPMIYTLMNLLWVVWTFSAIVGMVFKTTTGK